MTTVYVVTETRLQDGDSNDPTGVIGVYQTKEKAEEAVRVYAEDQSYFDELTFNDYSLRMVK